MNKKTKLYIGIMLIISAITTLFTFISLCFKKKGTLIALASFAAAEGLVGLALIEDNSKRRPKTAIEVDAEIFGDDSVDLTETDIDVDLGDFSDEENTAPNLEFDIPKDEDATEEDFQ